MTTGSLCLTEILKSWKSCSSKRLASHTADSTSASGVALPYFSSSRGSSEPALTPIRIDVPWSLAAFAISLTWSSNFRMLPGFTRTAAQPASIAAKTYFGWKWMSAITGICECRAISGSASASSWLGHATRTMSHPVAVSSAICCSVVFTSAVSVVVIDCTDTGLSLPTPTLPTLIWRVLRRGASTGGGASGMPRLMAVTGSSVPRPRRPRRFRSPWTSNAPAAALLPPCMRVEDPLRVRYSPRAGRRSRFDVQRYDEVADDQHDAHDQHRDRHDVGDRQQLGHVDVPGVGATA